LVPASEGNDLISFEFECRIGKNLEYEIVESNLLNVRTVKVKKQGHARLAWP